MAKAVLPVNFKDDVLDASMNGKRRYVLVQNSDGTYCLEDATVYTQVGSAFGQAQINATNKAVNESVDKAVIIDNINDIMANTTSKKVAGALALKEVNRDLSALNDSGAIKGMDAREDGVYITYVPKTGADAVTKKLGADKVFFGGYHQTPSDIRWSAAEVYVPRGAKRIVITTSGTTQVNQTTTFTIMTMEGVTVETVYIVTDYEVKLDPEKNYKIWMQPTYNGHWVKIEGIAYF